MIIADKSIKIKNAVGNKDYVWELMSVVSEIIINAFEKITVDDVSMYQLGYGKAIDDLINAADKRCGYYAGECKNLTRDDLLEIAKELKDNG